jgi:hypothetical protein
MLEARSAGAWKKRMVVAQDGAPVTTWSEGGWGGPGGFELDGRRYVISSTFLGSRYLLNSAPNEPVAEARRPGGRRWSLLVDGREHQFHRPFLGGGEHRLLVDGEQVGYVRKGGFREPGLRADLPGIPLPVQVFVLVVIALAEKRRSSGDMSSSSSGGGGGGGDG